MRANARKDLEALNETVRIQEYFAEVERLNGYAKLLIDVLMDLITCKIKPQLCNMIVPCSDLIELDSAAWKKKLSSCRNSIEQNERITKGNTNCYNNCYTKNRDSNNCNGNNRNNNTYYSDHDRSNRDQNKCGAANNINNPYENHDNNDCKGIRDVMNGGVTGLGVSRMRP